MDYDAEGMEGEIMSFSILSLGKREGSDSRGESLRKILYQAYHLLKKVKSAQLLTCRYFHICHVFLPKQKLDH